MKKVLSIMLTVMMLASLFAVNAFAAPVATYETVNIYSVNEDFQDATDALTVQAGNFVKVLETGSETNYVMDATATKNGKSTTSVMYADNIGMENIENFVLEFDVLPVYASAPISVGFNHPTYGDYGFVMFPGSFNTLSLKDSSVAQSASNPAWVASEDAIKGETWYSVRVTVDRSQIDSTLAAYEGYYFNYPKATGDDGKEIAIEPWGKTAGTLNSMAAQSVGKALTIEIDKGEGYVAVDGMESGSSYAYANRPRAMIGTGATPAAIAGSDLCIQARYSTAWYESVFTTVTEGEGEEAVSTDVSLAQNAVYQFDNIKFFYETEQLANVTDGTIAAQDYEDVKNNTAATVRENFGTATVVTEDDNSYLQLTSELASHYQAYTTLVNGVNFDKFNWEFEMDVNRKSGNNGIGINVYGYSADYVSGSNTDSTEACLIIPSSEFTENTWYKVKLTVDPIVSTDGTKVYNSYKVFKKNLSTPDSKWENGKYIFYMNNPSNANGKLVIQMTGNAGARYNVDVADGKLNPSAAATPANETNAEATYLLDNLKFTTDDTIKVTDIASTETTASATVTFSNASKYFTEDTYNVMMVSYDSEGRVVDVALEAATPVVGVVEDVELSVDKTDDVRVYVWETSTGTPLLGNVFDLSAWL